MNNSMEVTWNKASKVTDFSRRTLHCCDFRWSEK